MAKTNFRTELQKLNKGIRLAWFINFFILFVTFEAVMIFVFLDDSSTNDEIIGFLLTTSVLSAITSAATVVSINASASRILLQSSSEGLTQVTEGQLFNIVEEITIAAGLKKTPEVYVSSTDVANAYAMSDSKGRARIVVTENLLNLLNREEMQGVIAHEIGHIKSGDSAAMTKLVALTSTVGIISGIATRMFRGNKNNQQSNPVAVVLIVLSFILLLVAPLLSKLGNAYMSRKRESQADALSVQFTRDPTALASALLKLSANDSGKTKTSEKFNKEVGELAFYAPSFAKSLATHPPIAERIEELRAMGAEI